jgi:hypothetical protein
MSFLEHYIVTAKAAGVEIGGGMVYQGSDEEMISFLPSGSDMVGVLDEGRYPNSDSASGQAHSHSFQATGGAGNTGQPAAPVPACTGALMYPTCCSIPQPDGSFHVYMLGGLRGRDDPAPPLIQRFIIPAEGSGPMIGPEAIPFTGDECQYLCQHTAVAVGTHIYILGNAAEFHCRLLDFDTETRELKEVTLNCDQPGQIPNSELPPCFWSHTTVLMKDSDGSDLLVTYGGVGRRNVIPDVLAYNISGKFFTRLSQLPESNGEGLPPKRLYHAACASLDGRFMYIFGGAPDAKTTTGADVVFNDFWCYDLHTRTWSKLNPTGKAPSPRGSCSLLAVGAFLYLYGGFNGQDDLTDFYRYDIQFNSWTCPAALNQAQSDVGRWGYGSCVVNGSELYYFGGYCKRASRRIRLEDARLSERVQMYRPEKPSLRQLVARHIAASEAASQFLSSAEPNSE